MTQYSPNIIGTGTLQRNAPSVIRKVASSHQESFIVTHNEPKAVIMSLARYEELKTMEELAFIPHRKSSPRRIRQSFEKTGRYSAAFLDDLEEGLRKSSIYSR